MLSVIQMTSPSQESNHIVNVMLSLMSVMSPPPALCNLSVRTDVKLCIFGVLALGVSLVS